MPCNNIESLTDLKESFEYGDKIGSGKFGLVYKVVSKETGTTFAAKHVTCKRASEKKRIYEEVDIVGSLDHPHIMRLHQVFADTHNTPADDQIVLILEYLSGGDLFSRIMFSDDTFTEADISGFVEQILKGLEYIHNQRIVHLDIKPENIVCESVDSFNIKIVDFGLSRRLTEERDICVMQGTPDFVSPEVINFEPISTGSDMWSVGVVTYVLLSGLSPFLGNSNMETYNNITSCNYTLDEEQFDNVSLECKDFISHLLVLNQSDRLSAEECLNHGWITIIGRENQMTKERARIRWNKYGNTVKAVNRFRGIEKKV